MDKICTKCHKTKDINMFYRSKRAKDGRASRCAECCKSNSKKYCKKSNNLIRFGGNKYIAVERDGYKCVVCGMTDKEHHKRFNCEITIDHIDGSGRYSKQMNHALENLQTLCISCHARKDAIASWVKRKLKNKDGIDEV